MSGRRAGCPGLREAPDVRAKTPDVRAGRFCFWTEAPDFRAGGRMSGASWEAGCPGPGARMSGLSAHPSVLSGPRRRISGLEAGCLGLGAGCPGPGR